jgi:hypothetical protein
MARWEVEVIHEPTGQFMNFICEVDSEDEMEVGNEVLYSLSICPIEMLEGND